MPSLDILSIVPALETPPFTDQEHVWREVRPSGFAQPLTCELQQHANLDSRCK
jgi:hypothetical protein